MTKKKDLSIENNIFDTRPVGFGKTESAIEYIEKEVAQGKIVIFLMGSYDNLEEVKNKLSKKSKERTIIFEGRTRPGMCKDSEQLSLLYQKTRPSRNCRTCEERNRCRYERQNESIDIFLKEIDTEKQTTITGTIDTGFAVFTTPNITWTLLDKLEKRNITTIIDDIAIANLVMPESPVPLEQIRLVNHYLENKPDLPLQKSIIEALFAQDLNVKKTIKESKTKIYDELKVLSRYIETDIKSGIKDFETLPNINFLYDIIDFEEIIFKENVLLIFSSKVQDLTRGNRNRIYYINATPDIKNIVAMDLLGKYQEKSGSAQRNEKHIILQIVDSKNSKGTLKDRGARVYKDLEKIQRWIEPSFRFIDKKIVFMSNNDAYESIVEPKTTIPHDFVKFYGKESKSTNNYRNAPLCIIAGTPILPPNYFESPLLNQYHKNEFKLQEEREKNEGSKYKRPIYQVYDNVIQSSTLAYITQMCGRNLRQGENPNTKIVVLFSDAELSELDYLEKNGARIEKFALHNKKKIENDNGEHEFYKRFNALLREAIGSLILTRISEIIDQRLDNNEDVWVNEFAGEIYRKINYVPISPTIGRPLGKKQEYSKEEKKKIQSKIDNLKFIVMDKKSIVRRIEEKYKTEKRKKVGAVKSANKVICPLK